MALPPPDEQTLHQSATPPLDGPSIQPRPAELLARVRVEQQREWLNGQPVTVETLLQRHQALIHDNEAIVELAYNEFRLRSETGEKPTPEEYLRRFPAHASSLRHQFALLAALHSRSPSASQTVPATGDGATVSRTPENAGSSPTVTGSTQAADPSQTVSRALDGPEPTATISHQDFGGTPRGSSGSATELDPSAAFHEAATAHKTLHQPPSTPTASQSVAGVSGVPGYELLGELGRGGMGVVLKARQVRLNRLVALKMILSGEFANQTELHRFKDEAVQLARLQHPNIVQVYEVGDHNGRPFFAMEFMDGGSLSKQFNREPQTPRLAAEVMETLARAAHHAHTRGVVHRDLKPANVLLMADGTPKITDFGLAKGMDSEDSRTVSGAILGTPSYMAPEQASGHTKDVGPAADTYALGAILYEALTGRPPFRGATALDTVRMVTSVDPVPPSYLIAHLPRDIETICLKSLQKDPSKRYSSALEMAEDLRRFIDNRPILARPVPLWEKGWKWAKRRPAAAALAGFSAIVIVGGAVGGFAFARHESNRADENARLRIAADQNAELANRNYQESRDVVQRFLTDVAEETLLNEPGLERLKENLLTQARDTYAKFVNERANDPGARLDYGRGLFKLGKITADLNDRKQAIDLFNQALGVFQELSKGQPDDAVIRIEVASTWYYLGRLYRQISQLNEAKENCVKSVELWKHLLQEQPDDSERLAGLARSQLGLGNVYYSVRDFYQGQLAYLDARSNLKQLVDRQPKNNLYRRDFALSLDNQATLDATSAKWEDAERGFSEAREQWDYLIAQDPKRTQYRNDLARNQLSLGQVRLQKNHADGAAEAFRNAARIMGRLAELHPDMRDYQVGVANASYALSQALIQLGQGEMAREPLQRARAIRVELVAKNPSDLALQLDLARCDEGDGQLALQSGSYEIATAAFRRVIAALEGFSGIPGIGRTVRIDLARNHWRLGQALMRQAQFDDARAALASSLQLWETLHSENETALEPLGDLSSVMFALCELERRAGTTGAALEWFEERARVASAQYHQTPPIPGSRLMLRYAYWGQAEMLTALGRPYLALNAWDAAVSLADVEQRNFLRVLMLLTLAQTDDYADVPVVALKDLAGSLRQNATMEFQVARAFVVASQSAATDHRITEEVRLRRVQEYKEQAISFLKAARELNYFADRGAREDFLSDEVLGPLRAEPAFQKLVGEIKAATPASQIGKDRSP